MKKPARFRPLAALSALFSPPPPPRDEGVFAVRRTTLPNGLRVWVKPRPGSGTVYLVLQVYVGSRPEAEANKGISHFLEHILFTGTPKWDEADVMEVVRRLGGHSNARTSQEDTAFLLHLQSTDLDFGLDWLAEVVFRPRLPEAKFKKERNIIIQEKGGHIGGLNGFFEWLEDRGLGWNVFRAVRNRLFPESSLLLPVIGDDASLGRITYAQVTEFYRQHYLPNNMTLIVVGDVKPDEVVANGP